MQDCTHLSRFALVSTVFPMQKRKKVHRLLYHNLCTNVAAEEGFEPSQTESESGVLPLHNSAKRKSYYTYFCGIVKKNFSKIRIFL